MNDDVSTLDSDSSVGTPKPSTRSSLKAEKLNTSSNSGPRRSQRIRKSSVKLTDYDSLVTTENTGSKLSGSSNGSVLIEINPEILQRYVAKNGKNYVPHGKFGVRMNVGPDEFVFIDAVDYLSSIEIIDPGELSIEPEINRLPSSKKSPPRKSNNASSDSEFGPANRQTKKNVSEQHRRDELNRLYDRLKDCLDDSELNSASIASKLKILQTSIQLIKHLKNEQTRLSVQENILRLSNKRLQFTLNTRKRKKNIRKKL